jgi:hypothetical protein
MEAWCFSETLVSTYNIMVSQPRRPLDRKFETVISYCHRSVFLDIALCLDRKNKFCFGGWFFLHLQVKEGVFYYSGATLYRSVSYHEALNWWKLDICACVFVCVNQCFPLSKSMFVSILLLSFSLVVEKYNVWLMCAFWLLRSLSVHKCFAGMGICAWHQKKSHSVKESVLY